MSSTLAAMSASDRDPARSAEAAEAAEAAAEEPEPAQAAQSAGPQDDHPESAPLPESAADAGRPTRRWSRALVAGTVVATAAVVAMHLAATFLYNAPANAVSEKYASQVSTWMNPLFAQNWQLFAPNPISENVELRARASMSANGRITPWVDISAMDAAQITDDPLPGQVAENELRNAYFSWVESHDGNENPTTPDGQLLQQYLENVVIDRLAPAVGGQIGSIDIQATITLLPGPGRTAKQTAPQTHDLGWWVVQSSGAPS
jgi:hypothetical protein